MRRVLHLLAWITITASLIGAASGGNIVITGHDDDFHGVAHLYSHDFSGSLPAALQQMSQMAAFARKNAPDPTLPVLVLTQPGANNADRTGNVEARFPGVCTLPSTTESYLTCSLAALHIPFTVFDVSQGVPPASLFDITKYSAVGVPSFQGVGDDGDIDATGAANIMAASGSFKTFINSGGGVFAFASDVNAAYYNFLPNASSLAGQPLNPTGFSPGPDTVTVAISPVNGDPTHNFFNSPGSARMDPAWKVLEVYNGSTLAGGTVSNAPATIAIENGTVCAGGFAATPTITSPLSPAFAPAGGPAFELTINGSNFLAGDQVQWAPLSGSVTTLTPDTTTATQITVKVSSALLSTNGTVDVSVTRAASESCGVLTSKTIEFIILPGTPVVTSLNPPSAVVTGPAFTLTVNGSNFANGAQVRWTGPSNQSTILTPTSITPAQLTVNIDSSFIAAPGAASVAVVLPVAGTSSLVSNSVQLPISALSITSVSPSSVSAFDGDTPITLSGTGFQSGAQVTVMANGQSVLLTNLSVTPAQIFATIPGSALSGPLSGIGTGTVTVSEASATTSAQITIAPPTGKSIPNVAIKLASQPNSPTDQPTLTVTSSNPTTASNFVGVLALSFTPNASNVPIPFSNPGVSFSTGHSSVCFPLPAGPSSSPAAVDLTSLQNGMFSQGTVAGTIQIVSHLYYGASCTADHSSVQGSPTELTPTSPPLSLTVAQQAPVITSNPQLTNVSPSGFNVELNAYSTTRELTTISFTFTAASGTQLTGTTVFNNVSISPIATQWFSNSGSLPTGGSFHLSVPFTYSGNTGALGSVSLVIANSIGPSATSQSK